MRTTSSLHLIKKLHKKTIPKLQFVEAWQEIFGNEKQLQESLFFYWLMTKKNHVLVEKLVNGYKEI